MAEYYPLLAKAVAAIPNPTPEARRVVYERARKALLGQLQNLQPPIAAADLAREAEALDAAVARLESELGGKPAAKAAPAPGPRVTPRTTPSPPRAAPAPRGPSPGPSPAPPPAPNESASASAAADGPTLKYPGTPEAKAENRPASARDFPAEPRPATRVRLSERPMAPQPDYGDAFVSRRLWIVIGVVVLVVAAVAVAAWKLRDRPDQLVAFNKPAAQTAAEKNGVKNTDRVGAPAPAPEEQAAAPATSVASSSPPPAAPKPAPESAAPGAAATAAAAPTAPPASAATAKAGEANAQLPVAYRAALLVEAPEEPSKVKTYVGTVIWKLQNVSNGPGQPLATAVHADVSVPDDKLKITIDIQKNTDPSLSASHTMTIVFDVAPNSPTGGVKEISLPQLRNEDNPSGEPLKGVVVPIMDNSFLVGLTRGDAESVNIELLKKLQWIDIPIMLDSGRIAKLTFEKNASGSRAIDDAITSWQGQ